MIHKYCTILDKGADHLLLSVSVDILESTGTDILDSEPLAGRMHSPAPGRGPVWSLGQARGLPTLTTAQPVPLGLLVWGLQGAFGRTVYFHFSVSSES